jgi:cell division protein ZapA
VVHGKPLAPNYFCQGSREITTVSAKTQPMTEVQIFGAAYRVRGGDDSGYYQDLADLVDGKMREIARHLVTADTARIAILAALNLAEELFQIRKQQEGERVEIAEKVAQLTRELDDALGS